ncbi:hypothetical protein PQZ09_01980 [Methylophilaceae bacterium]|nr:hypothetical protein [Methylophilaceae bacterium]
MKKLFQILTLLFSTVIFSSTSYAEWTQVQKSEDEYVFFIDYETIRKENGFSYYWYLTNFPKPNKKTELSAVTLVQADCQLFRYKTLSQTYYKKSMGEGNPSRSLNAEENVKWTYALPKTVNTSILKLVCKH